MSMDDHSHQLARNGYVVLRGFYTDDELRPIQEGVRQIIQLVARKYGVDAPASTPEEAMKVGFPALLAVNRAYGSEVYDAVKQIPAFVALVGSRRNAELFSALRPGSIPGVAAGGYGIRIDVPGEEKYRVPWHQEFPAQLRSIDGLVFWSPLLAVTPEMGPVAICEGSHKEGYIPVYDDDGGHARTGAYALRLENEDQIVARYAQVAPLTVPGDLIIMDFLVLHASGRNVSKWPRWTMQLRYFNFNDPVGVKIGWKGSFAAGVKFAEILPELATAKKRIGS